MSPERRTEKNLFPLIKYFLKLYNENDMLSHIITGFKLRLYSNAKYRIKESFKY